MRVRLSRFRKIKFVSDDIGTAGQDRQAWTIGNFGANIGASIDQHARRVRFLSGSRFEVLISHKRRVSKKQTNDRKTIAKRKSRGVRIH